MEYDIRDSKNENILAILPIHHGISMLSAFLVNVSYRIIPTLFRRHHVRHHIDVVSMLIIFTTSL